jgi:regulator of sigma E protease
MSRALGIKVLRFSIGFGKSLLRWHDRKGTEYCLAAIPLGGYVKILDENEGEVAPHEVHLAFNRQPIYKRAAVIIAGPFSNLVFAFLIYWFLYVVGFNSIAPIIGQVQPNSIAAQAGLGTQQEIVAVNNHPTPTWTAVIIRIFNHVGETQPLQFSTRQFDNQQINRYQLNVTTWHMNDLKPDPLESLGIKPYLPLIPAIVSKVLAHSPAAQSLKIGDKILAVDNQPIADWEALMHVIAKLPGKTTAFKILRQGKTLIVPVTVGQQPTLFSPPQGFLGIAPQFKWPENYLRLNKYALFSAVPHAWNDTATFVQLNFILLGKLFTGNVSLKSLGGPITIFQSAGTALNQGFVPFLSFLAFLSISIGVINILPIPGLDGGHLLFQLLEFIKGKPVSLSMQILFYRFGMIILLLLITQAIVNDIMRL